MTVILGVNVEENHDTSACLVRDGRILAAAEEERFNREKHTCEMPTNAINHCLRAAGLSIDKASRRVSGRVIQ